MTDTALIDELQHDNQRNYFLLGAHNDAFNQLPEFSKHQYLKVLRDKQARATPDQAHALAALVESLEATPDTHS